MMMIFVFVVFEAEMFQKIKNCVTFHNKISRKLHIRLCVLQNLTYLSNVFSAQPTRNAVPTVNATIWALHGNHSHVLRLRPDV
jgi:hypothetical protein